MYQPKRALSTPYVTRESPLSVYVVYLKYLEGLEEPGLIDILCKKLEILDLERSSSLLPNTTDQLSALLSDTARVPVGSRLDWHVDGQHDIALFCIHSPQQQENFHDIGFLT